MVEETHNHSEGIKIIKEKLSKQFRCEVEKKAWTINGCIPDIVVNKGKRLIVVEVGSTKAIKINKYLDSPTVTEVRWYTKDGQLVGKWIKKHFMKGFMISRQDRRISKVIYDEFDGLESVSQNFDRLVFLCPNCNKRKPLSTVQIEKYHFTFQLVCLDCHTEKYPRTNGVLNYFNGLQHSDEYSEIPQDDNQLKSLENTNG